MDRHDRAFHFSGVLRLALACVARADTTFQGERESRRQVRVRFTRGVNATPLDDRGLVRLSRDRAEELRFQVDINTGTRQIFAVDLEGLRPGEDSVIDASALNSPAESLARVPSGTDRIQAALHRYETFHRADGRTVKLPMDRGEGQFWNKAAGNIHGIPREVKVDPSRPEPISSTLDRVMPSMPRPLPTKYFRREAIQGERLTRSRGRPMSPGGCSGRRLLGPRSQADDTENLRRNHHTQTR